MIVVGGEATTTSKVTPVAHGGFLCASRWLLRRLLGSSADGVSGVSGVSGGGECIEGEREGCLSPSSCPELWNGDGKMRVVVTGHSLGGSAAQILSALLATAMRRLAERFNRRGGSDGGSGGGGGETMRKLHAPPVHCFAFGPSPAVGMCKGRA